MKKKYITLTKLLILLFCIVLYESNITMENI